MLTIIFFLPYSAHIKSQLISVLPDSIIPVAKPCEGDDAEGDHGDKDLEFLNIY